MSSRFAVTLVLALAAAGCHASVSPPPPSPAGSTLALHAEGGVLAHHPGYAGAADFGFEVSGCCGAAVYVAGTRLKGNDEPRKFEWDKGFDRDDPNDARVNEILEGGIELDGVVPDFGARELENRLRLRVRAGKAGTPPDRPELGRTGYSLSTVLLVRAFGATRPGVNDALPTLDAFAGYSRWNLGPERTSAGDLQYGWNGGAVVFGLRVGVDYGVDFE